MAASGSAVTVLTPNGRRQTVKVSPNTPLLQVLEDVSKKHGFNPEDHGLKFQRTVLDLTMPWRFANLPNNAKLEMVPSARKQAVADSQVRIALQMEDGSRLQDSFSCGQSLWELLTHFPQISTSDMSQSTPVCVYMRDEVCGEEALKNTSLKSLGLTGGSAIVRFLLKNNKAQDEEDGRDATEPDAVSTTPTSASNSGPDRPEETPHAPSPVDAINTLPVRPEEPPNVQDAVRPKEPPPAETPSTSSSACSSSSAPSAPFIPFSGGGQRLGGPEGGARPSSSSLSALTAAVESPKAKKAKSSHSSTQKVRLMEREPLIYHLDSLSHHMDDNRDLPDEFFEVTMDDVRKRFAQLKSERKLLEESPLMTKALRESQMKEKMDRYPKVVLRVQFPDRHVLQGFFRPLETVAAVRQFVRSHLEDPKLSFYLCKCHYLTLK
uniref:RBD domain-containing protein n=1 Tax=Sphaeramia orbicularis TaxID=375764 RepID=A0A672Y3M4_9TELE